VLRPSAAAPLTETSRPPAAPASPAPLPLALFLACEFVAVLLQAMRVCLLAAAAARPPAAPVPPAPLSAAFGRTAVLPNPASLAGDDASAARYTPQRTRASKWSFKMILKDHDFKGPFTMSLKDRLKSF
jgi:hypothetical protein